MRLHKTQQLFNKPNSCNISYNLGSLLINQILNLLYAKFYENSTRNCLFYYRDMYKYCYIRNAQ